MRAFLFSTVASVAALALLAGAPTGVQAHEPPGFGYYGNGGHDVTPHWHKTLTPWGPRYWYGMGAHDFRPHAHSYDWRGYRGYSMTPWGPTTSYYSPSPYYSGYYGYSGYGYPYGGYASPSYQSYYYSPW
jgi:hypothetical protein